jgi:hypothetical protein
MKGSAARYSWSERRLVAAGEGGAQGTLCMVERPAESDLEVGGDAEAGGAFQL